MLQLQKLENLSTIVIQPFVYAAFIMIQINVFPQNPFFSLKPLLFMFQWPVHMLVLFPSTFPLQDFTYLLILSLLPQPLHLAYLTDTQMQNSSNYTILHPFLLPPNPSTLPLIFMV